MTGSKGCPSETPDSHVDFYVTYSTRTVQRATERGEASQRSKTAASGKITNPKHISRVESLLSWLLLLLAIAFTMERSSIPSVLVVRSMCVDSPERASDANTADSAITNDAHAMSHMLHQTLLSLPLTCDITILPEIPVEPTTEISHGDSSCNQGPSLSSTRDCGHHSNDSIIRMERQALYPCGMDNVFFLRDLPPPSAAAADPASYLLSITSCETTLTHLDTPNGVLELDPITVSIHAVPSTFLFAFENDAANTQGDNSVFVNPRKASVELDVHFDFFVALDRLEGMVKDNVASRDELGESDETLSHETLPDETPSHETPPLPFKGTEEKCQTTGEHIYEGHHHPTTQYHDQLLHVLHELVEKESRQLDWMLVGLGFVFILLMLHYARAVSPLIRSKQSLKKREKAASVVDPSPATRRSYDVETEVKGAFFSTSRATQNHAETPSLIFGCFSPTAM